MSMAVFRIMRDIVERRKASGHVDPVQLYVKYRERTNTEKAIDFMGHLSGLREFLAQ